MVEDAREVEVSEPEAVAVGRVAVRLSLGRALREMGVVRSFKTLPKMNQVDGFDCPSCAWPDPASGSRSHAEFCENGAKALSWEATRDRVGREFFAAHSIEELREEDDHSLERHGRLTEPMYLAPGATHYAPISWDDALGLCADRLRALTNPNRAVFYTSGRASNEAAFLFQLLARRLGTNNLPDCSNMCHESSGAALNETIGVGKGTVSLEDITDHAELIVIVGQNPGTNHPRMLSALEAAKERGARIVSANPLPEAGLIRFKNPQSVRGLLGRGTELTDRFLAVRVNGDLALFAGVNKALLAREDAAPGTIFDHAFIDEYCDGLEEASEGWRALEWSEIEAASGLTREEIEAFAADVVAAKSVIVCWAMGITQHRNAVATIREIVNFLLLRGNIGRPGAGPSPIRGHSNVQGDRTMGIWEKMPDSFLNRLRDEFAFEPPRAPGYDTVETIRALRDARVDVFVALGGNFVAATPDTAVTQAAMANCALTVHVATKLNRSHLHHGREALLLPCLGRSERDVQDGVEQFVTVEDSMAMVHASRGRLDPGSKHLRSEVAIVAGLGAALFSEDVGWADMARDYRVVRRHIEKVVPGFESFEERVAQPGGFVLPRGPHDSRTFATATGKARFTRNALDAINVPEGHLILQTIRSHDQFNTTVYGHDDRYRGIEGGRRVVLVNADDLAERGLADGDVVDLVSVWSDGERHARGFRAVDYPTPRGCAAAYFPEANVLVPLDSTALTSNTPTSKSIVIRLERPS
ncbi:MAG: FdhF/YdeP family oxidoreductase [Acidobacteriota bacterium]|nr:FdhF/YdeP family oxidoreductase [Acidobacteriota bacterium]